MGLNYPCASCFPQEPEALDVDGLGEQEMVLQIFKK